MKFVDKDGIMRIGFACVGLVLALLFILTAKSIWYTNLSLTEPAVWMLPCILYFVIAILLRRSKNITRKGDKVFSLIAPLVAVGFLCGPLGIYLVPLALLLYVICLLLVFVGRRNAGSI